LLSTAWRRLRLDRRLLQSGAVAAVRRRDTAVAEYGFRHRGTAAGDAHSEFVEPYFRGAEPDEVVVILKAREPAHHDGSR
jgi:hypothetical protein